MESAVLTAAEARALLYTPSLGLIPVRSGGGAKKAANGRTLASIEDTLLANSGRERNGARKNLSHIGRSTSHQESPNVELNGQSGSIGPAGRGTRARV